MRITRKFASPELDRVCSLGKLTFLIFTGLSINVSRSTFDGLYFKGYRR